MEVAAVWPALLVAMRPRLRLCPRAVLEVLAVAVVEAAGCWQGLEQVAGLEAQALLEMMVYSLWNGLLREETKD
jgi:hypothetical protein